MFGRLLGWYTIYTFSGPLAPEGILRSPILAALLHGTPAAGVSQTLRCGTRNGIYGTFADGATYIRLGGHHVGDRPTF